MTGDQRRVVLAAVALGDLRAHSLERPVRLRSSHHREPYLVERSAYLHGHGPRVELASAMHAGIASSFRMASMLASPCILVAGSLARRRVATE